MRNAKVYMTTHRTTKTISVTYDYAEVLNGAVRFYVKRGDGNTDDVILVVSLTNLLYYESRVA